MKTFTLAMLFLAIGGSLIAGPWYTHEEGIEGGDKVKNPIPSKERVYVFLRRVSTDVERDRNTPVKILRSKETKAISDVLKSMDGVYPKGYPTNLFVVVYRSEAGYEAAYQAMLHKAGEADFKIQARDVIWIGYST